MKKPPIGCLVALVVAGVILFAVGKEVAKSWRERAEHRKTTRTIREFAERHDAFANLQDAYEQSLPDGRTFLDALSVEKQDAVARISAVLTNGPVLFLGRIEDVQKIAEKHTVLLSHVDIFSPFRAAFTCSSDLAERFASQREGFMDTFAVIADVSTIEIIPPSEESSVRFVLRGTCTDALHCGRYWPHEGDLPNQELRTQ